MYISQEKACGDYSKIPCKLPSFPTTKLSGNFIACPYTDPIKYDSNVESAKI